MVLSLRERVQSLRERVTPLKKGEPRNSARVTPSRKGELSNSARCYCFYLVVDLV